MLRRLLFSKRRAFFDTRRAYFAKRRAFLGTGRLVHDFLPWCTIGAPFQSDGAPAILLFISLLRPKSILGAPFFGSVAKCG